MLVNDAGIVNGNLLQDFDLSAWNDIIGINLTGTFLGMRAGVPSMTIPLGRGADANEVSNFVLFLASDESSYATATEFVIDGGLTAAVPHKIF